MRHPGQVSIPYTSILLLVAAIDSMAEGASAEGLARLAALEIEPASPASDRNLADGALAYERETDGRIFVNRDLPQSLWYTSLAHELAHWSQRVSVSPGTLAHDTVPNATTAAYCLNPREINANFNAILAVASRGDGRRCPQAGDTPSALAVLLSCREGFGHGALRRKMLQLS